MKTKKIFAMMTAVAFLALLWVASGFETARPRTPAEAAPPGWSHNVLPLRAVSKGVGSFPPGQEPEGGVEIQSLMGTAFTYQGRLIDGGNLANGEYDFEFKLYDAPSDGTQIGSTVTVEDVTVIDGLFTVKLDFGSGAFRGDARYLEIGVRPGGSTGAYTTLDTRQELTPAPYALALPGLWTEQNPTSPNLIGGYSGNWVTSGVKGATIGGGGASGSTNRVTDDYGTVAGGYDNQAGDNAGTTFDASYATVGGGYENTATASATTVGGGWWNTASGSYATVGGGWSNNASGDEATVGGGDSNTASGDEATVGGGSYNEATASYATIAGGGPSDPNNPTTTNNVVYDDYGTIGGGGGNRAGSDDADTTTAKHATVGGGLINNASGWGATVGGGGSNTASGYAATVGGGNFNDASGYYATVGGGLINTASGSMATVGGGWANNASGSKATVGGGHGNTASYTYATVGGGGSNTASGYAATVGGGAYNVVTATYATIAGGGPLDPTNPTTTNNRVYDDYGTIGGGGGNRAGSDDGDPTTATCATVGGGYNNTASADYATVGGGYNSIASGRSATVGGGKYNIASGYFATVPGGLYAKASLFGQMAYASGRFVYAGDAQFSLYVMSRSTTTSGTWENLYLDGSSTLLTIPSGRTLTFDILVVGRSDGGESAGYQIYGVIENFGGTTSLIASTVNTIGEDDAAWNARVVADDENDALLVQVMGAGENIRWVAVVRTAEVAW
jgi:hypothetical protein